MAFPQNRHKDGFIPGPVLLFRRLIPHFAEYAEPLYEEMLQLNVTPSEVLVWAFDMLKDELWDGVAIQLPNPDKPFVVETDASIHAAGAVLFQSE